MLDVFYHSLPHSLEAGSLSGLRLSNLSRHCQRFSCVPLPRLGLEVDAISLLPLFFSVGSKDWIQVLMFAMEVLLANELSL